MIRNSDVTFVEGDSEDVIIPVADRDERNQDFADPPDPSEIRYVVSESFNPEDIVYEAEQRNINIVKFGQVKPADIDWPYPPPSEVREGEESYPRPDDTQDVIVVRIPAEETDKLPVTSDGGSGLFGEDTTSLIHECEIGSDASTTTQITVMQGTVTVIPSATSDS